MKNILGQMLLFTMVIFGATLYKIMTSLNTFKK